MHKIKFILILLAFAPLTFALPPGNSGSSTISSSTPGKASVMQKEEVTATVVSIDKKNRTIILKDSNGEITDIAIGEEVKNFNKIKVGDLVTAKYNIALTMELKKKTKGSQQDAYIETATVDSTSTSEKPGGSVGHKIVALA